MWRIYLAHHSLHDKIYLEKENNIKLVSQLNHVMLTVCVEDCSPLRLANRNFLNFMSSAWKSK